jgi:hypothetical protein
VNGAAPPWLRTPARSNHRWPGLRSHPCSMRTRYSTLIPERHPVRQPLRGSGPHRGLADRLGQPPTPLGPRLAHPGQVRRALGPPTAATARIASGSSSGVPSSPLPRRRPSGFSQSPSVNFTSPIREKSRARVSPSRIGGLHHARPAFCPNRRAGNPPTMPATGPNTTPTPGSSDRAKIGR